MSKLLVGLDLDDASGAPLRWARRIGEWTGFAQELVHVVEKVPTEAGLQILRSKHPEALDRILEEARGRVREQLKEWGEKGAESEVTLRVGRPSRELTAYAGKVDGGVLVLGAGRRRWVESLLGTTTDRALRTSPSPVLVARGVPNGKPSRIMAAVDLSAHASGVLEVARQWALALDTPITIFHVPQPRWKNAFLEGRGEHVADEMFERADEARARAGKELEALVKEHGEDVETEVELAEVGAWPPDAIAARLDSGEFGLLITGTHGAGGVDRFILGSVAESLTRRSPVPVLVVPGS